jgi:phage gpG-like protein
LITYRVDYDDKKVAAMFQTLERDMPEINQRILGLLAQDVTTRSQTRYLTGGHPLHHVTGHLSDSVGLGIHVFPEGYAVVGTNIEYGAYHEFGFHGRVQVQAHARHTKTADALVRAHGRNVNYAGRPFMRPALDDTFQSGRAVAIIESTLRDEIQARERAN